MILSRLGSVWKRIRLYGWQRTAEYAVFNLTEWWFERWYAIETSQSVELEEFGIHDRSLREYRTFDYLTLRKILRRLRIRPGTDVLLDFGAGKGRVLVVAATYPLKSVVGVELVPQFCAIARENIRRAERRLACHDVRVVEADATAFDIPADASIFFFHNPFGGEVLTRVFDNLRSSLIRHPREHHIVYVRPEGTGSAWVGEQPWLQLAERFVGLQGIEVYVFRAVL